MKIKNILWAVDPFIQETSLIENTWGTIRSIAKSQDVKVQPVYVLTPDKLNFFISNQLLISNQVYEKGAFQLLQQQLDTLKTNQFLKPKTLPNKRGNVRGAIEELIKYAHKNKHDLIVVSSHSRKGIARFFLGSFAETLLMKSDLPTLIVNAKTQYQPELKNILFATDFSNACKKQFIKCVELAKSLHFDLILYHNLPNPNEPLYMAGMDFMGSSHVVNKELFEKNGKLKLEESEKWVNDAAQQKVKTTVFLDENSESIEDGILKCAEKNKVDLILMTSTAGPIGSFLIGSTTRQVVRNAHVPVWVSHVKE